MNRGANRRGDDFRNHIPTENAEHRRSALGLGTLNGEIPRSASPAGRAPFCGCRARRSAGSPSSAPGKAWKRRKRCRRKPKPHEGPERAIEARAAKADHQPKASLAWPYDRGEPGRRYGHVAGPMCHPCRRLLRLRSTDFALEQVNSGDACFTHDADRDPVRGGGRFSSRLPRSNVSRASSRLSRRAHSRTVTPARAAVVRAS
jgi:hypothetical protein